MATTLNITPGYNCRIAIFFQSDKNGRKCAYYWTGFVSGRAIRMKLAEAEMLVAQDLADLLPCHPMKTPQEVAIVEEVTKPQLTASTITYTIVERDEPGQSPFYARVFVPGEEVQDFDPIRHDAWWQHTKSDLVFAVNKAFKGAWYLSPEQLEARVAEMTEASTEEPTSELTDEQRNAVLAQKRAESAEYLEQMDRETQAYIQEEIQKQVELQHKERITTMDQSFWKPGSIVKLQSPYKPSEPTNALLRAIAGPGSTYHQMIGYDKWHGFTHGIIAQVYAHDHQGNASHVSLHLYDPELHVIYIDNAVGIPTYVDYHISELTPYKDGSVVGYEVIR